MFKRILIPIDNDPGSRRAIQVGVELARSIGARITGFHAMTEFAHPGIVEELLEPPVAEMLVLAYARAEKLFMPLCLKAKQAEVPCETLAVRGDVPFKAIVAAAKSARCDLIVMASHGRRGVAKLVLGSQTEKVLIHGSIPVLVVH